MSRVDGKLSKSGTRQHLVLLKILVRRISRHAGRESQTGSHIIPVRNVNFMVRSQHHTVAAMPDPTRSFFQEFDFIELIVAIGVAQPIQRFTVVGIHVEAG